MGELLGVVVADIRIAQLEQIQTIDHEQDAVQHHVLEPGGLAVFHWSAVRSWVRIPQEKLCTSDVLAGGQHGIFQTISC
jgi:hypothetical protein